MFRKGSRLGKYRLEKLLGRGSFSAVWSARDVVQRRKVALKIASPEIVDEYGREAIEHEAQVATRLQHPNIVAIRNADWIEGRFVIATDLAERNLAEYAGARRSPQIGLQIIRDVAAGLAYAHEQRVLHRDVKPENVLIFSDRRAALADFGVSRFAHGATQTYTEAGTLGYMAPEQAYGRPRLGSDVFSLGLIAYELLTGTLPTWPFTWPLSGHRRFETRVPQELQPVLRRAASFNPRNRYPDATAFHRALESAWGRVERNRVTPRKRRRRRLLTTPTPLQVEADLFRRRHRVSLELRFDCHRCGGPVAEAMPTCPWCGTAENSFRDVTSFALVCPDCEKGVKPEWTACPWCFPGRFEGNGREPRTDARAERNCSRRGCAGRLRTFMRYCPICKQKVGRPWSHPDLHDRCPRCRWPVSRQHWRFCPWCSRREPRAGTFSRRPGG